MAPHHPYVRACGVDKNLSKMAATMHCGIGRLTLNSYRFVASCEPPALGPLEILYFE